MCYSWFSFDEAITFKLCFSIHSQTLLSKSNLWIFYLRKVSDKNLTLSLIDYEHGKLILSGQHEEMIVVRKNGMLERFDTIDLGFPIGLEEEIFDFLSQKHIYLKEGDVVVLYTDGITEAENEERQFYGLDRLCEVICQHVDDPAIAIRQAVIADLRSHIGTQKIYDDITLLVLKQR
jgi:serine phosphatase RsbU (regulator of sigma subunit)